MFILDNYKNIQPLSIYLVRPNGTILGCIDDYIEESNTSLTIGINQQYELTFDFVTQYDEHNTFRDYIQEGMYLYVDKVGLFKIFQPDISIDGAKEIKSVTALSCDSELEDKNVTVDLNMGTKTSQEYLVKYDDDEIEELINSYTGLPYDWLVLYNTFPEQLEIVREKYENNYYGEPDENGNIIVNDPEIVEELKSLFTTIPRLTSLTATNPTFTTSGNSVSFNSDYDDTPLEKYKLTINAIQSGGNITGWEQCEITHSNADSSESETINVSWQSQAGTIFGGYLNVTNGELVVTHGICNLNTIEWEKDENENGVFYGCIPNRKFNSNIKMCDTYLVNNDNVTTEIDYYISGFQSYGEMNVFIRDTRYENMTGEEFSQVVEGDCVFEFDEPRIYQITPQEITTYLGINIFSANCGDSSIIYKTNPTIVYQDTTYLVQKTVTNNNGEILTTNDGDNVIADTAELQAYILSSAFGLRVNDLITFYSKYRNQLSVLSIVLENTGNVWSVGNIYGISEGDYSIANTKCQFEVDTNIYSFLTQDLAKSIECVINFDVLNRKVNITPVDKIGEDTGIIISYDNLLNQLNVSTDEDKLATRLNVLGADDIDITRVNFGQSYIDDITYKLNARNENGKRIYVTDDLAEKYEEYLEFRENQREKYIQLSKEYEKKSELANEIQHRVPNDNLKNEWEKFTLEELQASLTNFNNLLTALEIMYKFDYGEKGLNQDGSINENYIRTTFYWYDYTAYKNIIKEIECAIEVFPYYNDQSKWTSEQITRYKNQIKAWETDWSLYGIKELQAKIKTYKQNMDLLAESSVIRVSSNSDIIKTWSQLTNAEKEKFGFLEVKYFYDTYMEYYNNKQSAELKLAELQEDFDVLTTRIEEIQQERIDVSNRVKIENYFTEQESKAIYTLYRDADYSNDNIVITSIDSTDEKIDKMVELLNDGKEQVSILGRPQLSFKVDSDNLLALPEFQPFWDSFLVGNYMYVQYRDNTHIKLRMVSYTFNPMLPTGDNFSMEFSNYIHSNVKISDIESVLGSSGGSVSSRSGSSRSGSGEYGKSDDIDITISNTMLSRLLTSQDFGSHVTNIITNTINANAITSQNASNTEVSSVRQIAESAVQDVVVLFAKSSSQTVPPTSGWSTDAPVIQNGEYIWQKTITIYGSGQVDSDVVCMTGKNGLDGESALTVILDSSAGIIFKRHQISTTITATVYYGTTDVTQNVTRFTWTKRDKNGNIDATWSRPNSSSITLTSDDVDSKAIFVCDVEYTR